MELHQPVRILDNWNTLSDPSAYLICVSTLDQVVRVFRRKVVESKTRDYLATSCLDFHRLWRTFYVALFGIDNGD
jgi:hypothetical protein